MDTEIHRCSNPLYKNGIVQPALSAAAEHVDTGGQTILVTNNWEVKYIKSFLYRKNRKNYLYRNINIEKNFI